ncbi:hypothetical protein BBH88_03275 [Planococcus antarcticus DSM 14505]|uniref:Uncharacterized protein n=1 Tax=Planococcus antarcticus DSM 14505 TaxID=1185653 RepID=A0ABN4RBX2_9BACL|nr:hypothetical protein [Planococcus antarcticus]ANU09398.1 hypothetical protein BBH88_03275 [Planococcus antarcticus DSM 14505]
MSDTVFQSFQNVRKVVDNSIKLLKDADALLAEKNYTPILGNGLATESSKSILQSADSFSTLVPQYIARPYALKSQLANGTVDHLYVINIQFTHPSHQNLQPTIATGLFSLETPTENIRSRFKPWFTKYAIFERDIKFNTSSEEQYACEPFSDCTDTLQFHIAPLTSIKTNSDTSKMLEKMYQLTL